MLKCSQKGFSMNFTILVVMFVFTLGLGLISLTQIGSQADRLAEKTSRAVLLAQVGVERAQTSLINDDDWGDNTAALYTDVAYSSGTYSVTLSSITSHNLTITSVGTFGTQRYTVQRNISRNLDNQFYLSISTGNAGIEWPLYTELTNIELSNVHPSTNLVIDKLLMFWLPDGGEKTERIEIGGTEVWTHDGIGSPSSRQFSGVEFNLSNMTITANGADLPFDAFFDSNMSGKVFSLYYHLSDTSVAHADLDAPDISDMAGSMAFDTSNTQLVANGKTVNSLDAVNANTVGTISVIEVNIAWTTDSGEKLETVKSSGMLWSGSVASGVTVDITDMSVAASSSKAMSFEFDSDMHKLFTMKFHMSDDTIRSYEIDFRTAQYLDINPASSSIDPDNVLSYVMLTNNDNRAIILDKMVISVIPDGGQVITQIDIGGDTLFNGTSAQGVSIDMTDVSIGNSSELDTVIYFDGSVVGVSFNITYEMDDGSSTGNIFSVSSMAAKASINTDAAYITSDLSELKGIYLTNISSVSDVTVADMIVTWTPDDSLELQEIYFNGTREWFDNPGTDPPVDATSVDYDLHASDTNEENTYQFIKNSDDMLGKDYFLTFSFDDGSEKTVTLNFNPASNIAGDNGEAASGSGGAGFVGGWTSGGSAVEDSASPFSGVYAFQMSGTGAWMQRRVDLSSETAPSIKFFAKLNNLNSGEQCYFKISDDNKSTWKTVKTWVDGDDTNAYVLYEFDLSGYTMSSNFYLSFECESSGGEIFIDEIYIF
ncbi:MAG: hypothetical protein ACI9BD_001214 [Candidatus Marinamargulisbacteria bacterium]|jgi:hypothetical protein